MALVTWPDYFPKPQLRFKTSVDDPVLRTAMDKGHKARSQFPIPVFNVSFTVRMTEEQFQYFQSWHIHKINNGADWFNMPVRLGSVITQQEVRFRRMYKTDHSEAYRVSITMELEQRTDSVPDETAYDSWAAAQ